VRTRSRVRALLPALAALSLLACDADDGPGDAGDGADSATTGGTGAGAIALEGRDEAGLCSYLASTWTATPGPHCSGCNESACTPGAMTDAAQESARARVNAYRGLAGVPPVGAPTAAENAAAQACAMMMSAEEALSHDPGPDWACYDPAGANAAGRSNLAYGASSPETSIDLLHVDYGTETLGHRRWILYPNLAGLGYGYFGDPSGGGLSGFCQIIWAEGSGFFAEEVTYTHPVAWPPAGAVDLRHLAFEWFGGPQPVRWSLSWHEALLTGATVEMVDVATGDPVPFAPGEEPRVLEEGYGMNTIAWTPARAMNEGDRWAVRVEGALAPGSGTQPVTYEVEAVRCP
jgi:uncharacterized protein YkwD